MSATDDIPSEIVIRRMIAQSDKFVAEQRKLMSESMKFERERRLAPWLGVTGLIGGILTILHAIGFIH